MSQAQDQGLTNLLDKMNGNLGDLIREAKGADNEPQARLIEAASVIATAFVLAIGETNRCLADIEDQLIGGAG